MKKQCDEEQLSLLRARIAELEKLLKIEQRRVGAIFLEREDIKAERDAAREIARELADALERMSIWSVGGNALTKHEDVMNQAKSALAKFKAGITPQTNTQEEKKC